LQREKSYLDKLTGRTIAPVTTGQIYWGAVPFVVIQLIMVGIIIAFPQIVTVTLTKSGGRSDKIEINIPSGEHEREQLEREGDIPDFGGPKAREAPPAK